MKGIDVIRFFHVFAAIAWVGGGLMLQVLLYRARKLGPEVVSTFTQAASWTSQRLFMPAAFGALVFGIWLVIASPIFDWDQTFIQIGIGGFVLSTLNGMALLGPTSKKLVALGAERGPNDPVVTHLTRRVARAGQIDLLILIVVVFNMVVKPGL